MACNEFSCGTGLGEVVLPGDPSDNSIISAVAAYGGVDVSWTYPTVNAYGVAFFNLYRGINADVSQATLHRIVSGNSYYDRIDEADIREYFYWIQIISVNGTQMEKAGPARATPRSTIENTIANLTGKIDAGVLAKELRSEIGRITGFYDSLESEAAAREAGASAIALALSELQRQTDGAVTYVNQEVSARQDANSAIVRSIDAIAVGLDSTQAAVLTEKTARIAKDNALASQITQTESTMNGQVASVQTRLSSEITAVDGKVTQIGALYTAKVNVNGLVGGFGIYNNGTEVQAGFDVDNFWIGRTNANKKKPFIISNGVVYIDEGAIQKLTFSKLRDESGSFVVENNKVKANYIDADTLHVKGQVSVGDYTGYAWPPAGGTGIHISAQGLLAGNANGGGKYFQIYTPAGGVAQIATNIPAHLEDAQVSTLKLAGNAVTVPISVSHGSSGDVTSALYDFGGGAVHLIVGAYLNEAVANYYNMVIRIYRDGALIKSQGFRLYIVGDYSWESGFIGGGTLVHLDYPDAGRHYYRAQAYIPTSPSININLMVLGVKR